MNHPLSDMMTSSMGKIRDNAQHIAFVDIEINAIDRADEAILSGWKIHLQVFQPQNFLIHTLLIPFAGPVHISQWPKHI